MLKLATFLLASTALASPALAQRQPAILTTTPSVNPTNLDLLDSAGHWVPVGSLDASSHMFIPTNMGGPFQVKNYHAVCDGVTDDAAHIQAAVNAATAAGGGDVLFPSSPLCAVASSVTVAHGGVRLIGQNNDTSGIKCLTGVSDCVQIAGAPGAYLRGSDIRNMAIDASAMLGGNAIGKYYTTNSFISNVRILNAWNGILESVDNNDTIEDSVVILQSAGAGQYGLHWTAPFDETSQVLVVRGLTINCQHNGVSDGFDWDGWSQTFNSWGLHPINCKYAVRIQDTNADVAAGKDPSVGMFDDLEADGNTWGFSDEGASNIHISNSDINAANNYATGGVGGQLPLNILQKGANGSVVYNVMITNTHFGNGQQSIAFIDAPDVTITTSLLNSASMSGDNLYPTVEFGPHAQDDVIANSKVGAGFGNPHSPSYSVQTDVGSKHIILANNDYTNETAHPQTDTFLIQGNAVQISGGWRFDGTPISPYLNDQGLSAGRTVNVYNPGVVDTTQAIFQAQTGDGTKYVNIAQSDGATPSASIATSAADTGGLTITTKNSGSPLILNPGSGPVQIYSYIQSSAAAGANPSIASNDCGATSQGLVTGTDMSGQIAVGSTGVTTCRVTFGTPHLVVPKQCQIGPGNSVAANQGTLKAYMSSFTLTGFTIQSAAPMDGAVYDFVCI